MGGMEAAFCIEAVICCVSRETSSRTACRSRWMSSILTTLAMIS